MPLLPLEWLWFLSDEIGYTPRIRAPRCVCLVTSTSNPPLLTAQAILWGFFLVVGLESAEHTNPQWRARPSTRDMVARLFRHEVLQMLLEEEAIEEREVGKLLAWPHTGFGAHVSREIPADAKTLATVARYMTRPPLTPDRMPGEAGRAQVIYRSDIVHPRHQGNFRVFDPLDFLAEVGARIPDPHEKTMLLSGWYPNRTRGPRKQHGLIGKA